MNTYFLKINSLLNLFFSLGHKASHFPEFIFPVLQSPVLISQEPKQRLHVESVLVFQVNTKCIQNIITYL